MAPRAQVAASIPESTYMLGGFTSQDWPVVVQLTNHGNRMRLALAALQLSCSQDDGGPFEDAWSGVPIPKSGKINLSDQIPAEPGLGVSLTGGSHSLSGSFNRKRTEFRGTWREHLTFVSTSGETDQCDSGAVSVIVTL